MKSCMWFSKENHFASFWQTDINTDEICIIQIDGERGKA